MGSKSDKVADIVGSPLQRVSLFEALAHQIEEFILSGELAVGSRMPTEDVLADQFGVSRPVVREALARLRDRGLLESRPRAGAFVKAPGAEHLHAALVRHLRMGGTGLANVVEARASIEATTTALAAQRATPADLAEIRRHLDIMRSCRADRTRFTQADMAFHTAIAAASHNPMLSTLLNPFLECIERNVALSHQRPQAMSVGMQGHERIWQAIEARDPVVAERAMRDHLAEGMRFLEQAQRRADSARTGTED